MKFITLKSLTPYFFGYNQTFGEGNYFARSAKFPQQTMILGMIRREILLQAGLLKRYKQNEWVDKKDYQKARELVGRGKFSFIRKEDDNRIAPKIELGKIKSISPVFICEGDDAVFEIPCVKEIKTDPLSVNFNYKEGVWGRYYNSNAAKSIRESEIFREIDLTHNNKKKREDSFFKQICYKLNDGFKFGFFMECDFELQNSVVRLGADGGSFYMNVVESDKNFDDIDIISPIKSEEKLSLIIGDSYVDLKCDFAITKEYTFKTIKHYGPRKGKKTFYKSREVYLYEKGSLIVNDKTDYSHFGQKIGFNISKIIKEAK